MDEGYIKYTCTWLEEDCGIPAMLLEQLNEARKELREKGMIGAMPDGVGFGNISIREAGSREFWISGSATGGLAELRGDDLARVICVNIHRNHLTCQGRTIASSEAMSHGAIYEARPEATAIIHVHDADLWHRPDLPSTEPGTSYGTVEMAEELKRLARDLPPPALIVMKGHEEGVIGFGEEMESLVQGFR